MRKSIYILFSCLFFVQVHAESEKTLFAQANEAYRQNDFEKAISGYEKLVAQKNNSATVYFNLANAYFKSGNIGKAILNYERAERLAPFDEDIHHNLLFARHKTVDQILEHPVITDKFFGVLSSFSWKMVTLVLVWVGFVFMLLNLISNSLKKTRTYIGITCLTCACVTFWFGKKQGAIEYKCHFGVVMSEQVYVKSAPDNSSTDLFILHEGAKVQLYDNVDGFTKIRIADGRVGWIPEGETAKI